MYIKFFFENCGFYAAKGCTDAVSTTGMHSRDAASEASRISTTMASPIALHSGGQGRRSARQFFAAAMMMALMLFAANTAVNSLILVLCTKYAVKEYKHSFSGGNAPCKV